MFLFPVSSVRLATGSQTDCQVGVTGSPPETIASHRALYSKGKYGILKRKRGKERGERVIDRERAGKVRLS